MFRTSGDNSASLRALPHVDGDEMLWIVKEQQALLLSEPEPFAAWQLMSPVQPEPSLDYMRITAQAVLHEPRVDEKAFLHRLKADPLETDGLALSSFSLSLLWHVVLVGFTLGMLRFMDVSNPFDRAESEPIEVAFGLNIDSSKSLPDGKKAEQMIEAEALKTLQQLPQLPKSLAPDVATPPPVDDSLVAPSAALPTPQPTARPTTAPTPAVVSTPQPQDTKPKMQAEPSASKKLKLEELAKRLEKENRAVGEKQRAGTQKKTSNDVFKRPSNIPINPLGRDLPKAPSVLGSSGSLQGQVGLQVKNEYAQAAALHMRRHWNLPDVLNFESKLEVVLGFEINSFGNILGRVTVVKASGNERFDEEAVKALESAGPFPELPKEMGQRLSMRMKFSPNSINF
jgi:TonB family protein